MLIEFCKFNYLAFAFWLLKYPEEKCLVLWRYARNKLQRCLKIRSWIFDQNARRGLNPLKRGLGWSVCWLWSVPFSMPKRQERIGVESLLSMTSHETYSCLAAILVRIWKVVPWLWQSVIAQAPLDISIARARYKPRHGFLPPPLPHTGFRVYRLHVNLISVLKGVCPTLVHSHGVSVLTISVEDVCLWWFLFFLVVIEYLTRSNFRDEGLLSAYSSRGHNTSCRVGGLTARVKTSRLIPGESPLPVRPVL